MPPLSTQAAIETYNKTHKKGGLYPKFNLQSGDKDQQYFYLKLLPRLLPESAACNGPFHEFYMHYGCGPDGDQSLVCLNKDKEENKRNAQRCTGCTDTKKITRNKENYPEPVWKSAERKMARQRINWPVYDLEKRKGVEMLEVSGRALREILGEFKNDDNSYLDLTDCTKPVCLEVQRTGSGQYCKYQFRKRVAANWMLTNEDVPNIRNSYIAPEVIENARMDREAFDQVWSSSFDLDTDIPVGATAADLPAPATAADLNALAPSASYTPAAMPPAPASAPGADLSALSPVAPAAPQRQRPSVSAPVAPLAAAPLAPPVAPVPPAAAPLAVAPAAMQPVAGGNAALLNELEGLQNLGS